MSSSSLYVEKALKLYIVEWNKMKEEMLIELLHVHEECTGDAIVIFVPRESRFETFVVSALFLRATRLM